MIAKKNDTPLFEKIGGWKRIVKYANESDENFAKVLTIFGKQLLEAGASVPAVENDPHWRENFDHLIESVVKARVNHALGLTATITSNPNVANPGEQHAISDTPKAPLPQPLLEQPNRSPATDKPDVVTKVDDVKSRRVQRVESIPGLNAGALLDCSGGYPQSTDANGNPTYGVNFSQLPASRFGS